MGEAGLTLDGEIAEGRADPNKHTWAKQYARFMDWQSDYIVEYKPLVGKFRRCGVPLHMQTENGQDPYI